MFTIELVGGPGHRHTETRDDAPAELEYPRPFTLAMLYDAANRVAVPFAPARYVRHWRHEDGVVLYRYVPPPLHDEGAGL